jgi:hypothetical protein
MRLIPTIALVALMSLNLSAADIAGTWKGPMETPMGAMETTITIESGPGVQGMVKTEFFEAKIENGKLDGAKISFEINVEFGKLPYEGTVAGDEMKLNVTGPDGNKVAVNCKRQK